MRRRRWTSSNASLQQRITAPLPFPSSAFLGNPREPNRVSLSIQSKESIPSVGRVSLPFFVSQRIYTVPIFLSLLITDHNLHIKRTLIPNPRPNKDSSYPYLKFRHQPTPQHMSQPGAPPSNVASYSEPPQELVDKLTSLGIREKSARFALKVSLVGCFVRGSICITAGVVHGGGGEWRARST